MRILITNTHVPFVRGGAEFLADELKAALIRAGHEVEIVAVPFKWYPPERIPEHMLACQLLDITEASGVSVDLVVGLKFPAYLIPHPNKVMWLVHQHRTAYNLWDHPLSDLINHPNGVLVRDAIIKADKTFIPECKKIYTISKTVTSRLQEYCEISSKVLYHPPSGAEHFYCESAADYIFFPSRINQSKRQSLVIQALAHTKNNVIVKFAGKADYLPYENELKKLASKLGVSNRVEWLGSIDEQTKRKLYANCIGVVYPADNEDYGYITLEAMLSSKPVITCVDSGGPLEFVKHKETGLITSPEPKELGQALDELWGNRNQSNNWGKAGRAFYDSLNISWDNVVQGLTK